MLGETDLTGVVKTSQGGEMVQRHSNTNLTQHNNNNFTEEETPANLMSSSEATGPDWLQY